MIGALLGAAVGFAQLKAQQDAAANAQALNWRNFYLQQRIAEENMRLAKASRSDALGNKVEYVPGVGFVTRTTPMTKALLNSIQYENLQRNRVDMPIRRQQIITNASRRRLEDDASREALAEYRYGKRDTEGSLASAFEDIALRGYRMANEETASTLAKQALRSGNLAALRQIQKNKQRQSGDALIDALMQAKAQGKNAYAQQEATRGNTLQRALALSQSAGQIDANMMGDSNAVERLANDRDNMQRGMHGANEFSSTVQGRAYEALVNGEFKRGDAIASALGSIGSSLGGLNFDFGGGGGGGTQKDSSGPASYSMNNRPIWYGDPSVMGSWSTIPYTQEPSPRLRGNMGAF